MGRCCPQRLPSKEAPTGVCCQPASSHPFAQSRGVTGLGPSPACPARHPLLPAPPCPNAQGPCPLTRLSVEPAVGGTFSALGAGTQEG